MQHSYSSHIYWTGNLGEGTSGIVHINGHGIFLSLERKLYIVLMIRYWVVTPVK
jgi:hypothetical protein